MGAADPNAPTTLGAADPNAPAALGAADPNALILDAFPDHHDFTEAEIRRAASRSRALVVTEKDAVKLAEHATALGGVSVHVLTLEVVWEEGEAEAHAVIERLTGART
ncbi:MAG: hypothetical protein HKN71_00805 [Gemmatimonadetes bacterium]|nr:hypothetical protein [Gemmatimonadota bacterium]